MRDLALNFNNGRYSLSGGVVEGFDSTAQVACVCLLTTAESSRLDPDKGTSLSQRLLSTGAAGEVARKHQLNFASLDTHFFINSLQETRSSEKILSMELQEEDFTRGNLELNLFLTGENGSSAGISLEATLL